jgi:hypothetical protein
MLDFEHKPPRGPEDISLSETGKFLLKQTSRWDTLDILGRGACSEVVDSFGEDEVPLDTEPFADLTRGVLDEAVKIVDGNGMSAFVNGMHGLRIDLLARVAEVETRT